MKKYTCLCIAGPNHFKIGQCGCPLKSNFDILIVEANSMEEAVKRAGTISNKRFIQVFTPKEITSKEFEEPDKYVVVVNGEEGRLFLSYETPGTIDPVSHKTISQPMGHFSTDSKDAMIFGSEILALASAAAYQGAEVIKFKGV